MMDEKSINEFLIKYAANSYTDQEHQLFIDWLNVAPVEQIQEVLERYQIIADLDNKSERISYPGLVQDIERKLDELDKENLQTGKVVRLWLKYKRIGSVAAVFLMISGFIFYFSLNHDLKQTVVKKSTVPHKNEISPGGNKAILTLANGKTFVLDNAKNGILAEQFGVRVRKTREGQVVFDLSNTKSASINLQTEACNTITTPRGGQYQVVLPDGSKVWLNAASSLKFPAVFSSKQRNVDLNGEAYFEVAKLASTRGENRKNIPFRVKSGKHVVEVLGTHFNIKAYADETTVTTTLLEGSVKVLKDMARNSKLLKPGQQAKVGTFIEVSNVDATEAIAWKNGYFNFSHENIESIMRNISRWYDIDVRYSKNITQEEFVGSVSRYENVSQVLDMLQLTGSVHFKVEGRRITVMP